MHTANALVRMGGFTVYSEFYWSRAPFLSQCLSIYNDLALKNYAFLLKFLDRQVYANTAIPMEPQKGQFLSFIHEKRN